MTIFEDEDILGLDAERDRLSDTMQVPADTVLAYAALESLITPDLETLLAGAVPVCILLDAPSSNWALALHSALLHRFPDMRGKTFTSQKAGHDRGDDHLNHLLAGHSILAVAPDLDFIPSCLRHAADLVLSLKTIPPRVIEVAISEVTGEPSPRLDASEYAGLSLADLAAAIRPHTTPAACRQRLLASKEKSLSCRDRPWPGPGLADLGLAPATRAWSEKTLAAMAALVAGTLSHKDAPFTLLSGPTGIGKTTLVAALARTAGWSLVSTSVSDWLQAGQGGLSDVTRAAGRFFDQLATADKPVIALIDGVDVLPGRNGLSDENRNWWAPVIATVLQRIDTLRFGQDHPVLLMAATCYPDRLDPSLTRPGRLGDHFVMPYLTEFEDINAAFALHLAQALPVEQVQELARMAISIPELTPAMIQAWVGTARITALERNTGLAFDDLKQAIIG